MTYKEQKRRAVAPDKYILYGEEEYLIEDFVKSIKGKLNPSFAEFNFITIYQDKIDYLEAVSKIESVPMMDSQKVVYFPEFITRVTAKNLWSKKDMEQFMEKLQSLSEDTWVLMKLLPEDRKNNTYKKMLEICQTLHVEKLTEKDFLTYIQYQFKQKGLALSSQLAHSFMNRSGYFDRRLGKTLYDVNSDLDKVMFYLQQNQSLDDKTLDQLMSPSEGGMIFDIETDILHGRWEEALQIYRQLESQDKTAKLSLSLLGALGRKLAIYIKATYLLNKGYSQTKIAKELNVKTFYLTKALVWKTYFTVQEALEALNALNVIDYNYKMGEIPTYLMGEMILMTMKK